MDFGKWVRVAWDRVLAAVFLALVGAVLLTGWLGISHTPYPAEQLPFLLSAGVGGIILAGAAATLWLSADLHDEWLKLDSIDTSLRELVEAGSSLVAPAADSRDVIVDRDDPRRGGDDEGSARTLLRVSAETR